MQHKRVQHASFLILLDCPPPPLDRPSRFHRKWACATIVWFTQQVAALRRHTHNQWSPFIMAYHTTSGCNEKMSEIRRRFASFLSHRLHLTARRWRWLNDETLFLLFAVRFLMHRHNNIENDLIRLFRASGGRFFWTDYGPDCRQFDRLGSSRHGWVITASVTRLAEVRVMWPESVRIESQFARLHATIAGSYGLRHDAFFWLYDGDLFSALSQAHGRENGILAAAARLGGCCPIINQSHESFT